MYTGRCLSPERSGIIGKSRDYNAYCCLCKNYHIWAATWQKEQNECAPSEDSDQPGHPSSLSTWRKLGSWATHWAHSEDSDQTGRMPRLIWVFAGRTLILLILSCRGSFKQMRTTIFVWTHSDVVPAVHISFSHHQIVSYHIFFYI